MSTLNTRPGKRRFVASLGVALGLLAAACTSPGKTPAALPTASVTPATSAVPAAVAPDLRNATFDVPDFPGTTECPAGRRTFADGRVSLPETEISAVSLGLMGEPLLGDVDADGRAEVLTAIGCYGYTPRNQVLALKLAADGGLSPLGFVLRSPDHPSLEVDMGEPIVVNAAVVTVTVLSPGVLDGGHHILEQQQRGYRYEGGSFRQVAGPTRFATPPTEATKIDVRNATVMLAAAAGTDVVKLRDGVGQATLNKVSHEVKLKQATYKTAKNEWLVLFELRSPAGVIKDVVVGYDMENLRVLADSHVLYLKTGDDGIQGIDKFDLAGSLYKVTVRTAAGSEVRMYRYATDGRIRWARA
jgi:hypothetical protein